MSLRSLPGLGILALGVVAGSAAAAPIETVLGVDVARGTEARVIRGAFAGVGVGLGDRAAVSLALAGADDSQLGRTSALAAAIGFAPSPTARLRLRVVRSLATGGAPAFVRVLAGPEIGAIDATRLGLLYVHEATDAGDRSHGARAELAVPAGARWTVRATGAWSAVPRADDACSATLGAGFAPARGLELVGECGVARGTALSGTALVPSQGPTGPFPDEVLTGDGTTTRTTPIGLVGLRVTLP